MARTRKSLYLDRENKKFLGVCAGIANYLEVEAWSVRLVFLVSIFFGAVFMIPLYFIAWFCLDEASKDIKHTITESHALKHFKTVDYKKKIYRNTEDAKFLGVCAGVADYLEVNVFAVRMIFVCLAFFTLLPVIAYFGGYFVLDKKPVLRLGANSTDRSSARQGKASAREESGEAKDSASYANATDNTGKNGKRKYDRKRFDEPMNSKRREFKYCARKFVTLQKRLARMEAFVTSSQFKLHSEFKSIS